MGRSLFLVTSSVAQPRSIVHIDGFNLYYGTLKGGPYKWLKLDDYFIKLRQSDDVQRIWYFTALVDGARRPVQQTYLAALETCPLVKIQLGLYKRKTVVCTHGICSYSGIREFTVPEEKGTDVNIAIQMLDDAYQGAADRMVLVSGDSDLVAAVQTVKLRFPHLQVIVYVPARDKTRGAAVQLRNSADKHRTLPLDILKHAQFPPKITLPSGSEILKPSDW